MKVTIYQYTHVLRGDLVAAMSVTSLVNKVDRPRHSRLA